VFSGVKPITFYNAIRKRLRERNSQAIVKVDEPQLRRTWEEFEYHVDVSRVTNGPHIEHL
jgi:chromosome condensin MukBEF ATPase and DNA-binding subunit MukB